MFEEKGQSGIMIKCTKIRSLNANCSYIQDSNVKTIAIILALFCLHMTASAAAEECPPVVMPKCENGAFGIQYRTPAVNGLGCRRTNLACPNVPSTVPYATPRLGCGSEIEGRGNGCSVGLIDRASRRFKIIFNAACNEHDRCYMTPGMNKEICDKIFLRNMLYSCKSFYQAGLGRTETSRDIDRIVVAFNLPKNSFCFAAATT